MLRVRLFGDGRIANDAADLKLQSRAWTLPLLAYLLLHRGEMIPRRRVAFALWPDEPEEAALSSLRRNLHRLVKSLPPAPADTPWLETAGHSIVWNASAPLDLDVEAFERLRSDPATLESALAFYAGDFLPEHDAQEWIASERERLRALYHADLATMIAASRSRRAFSAAIGFAQRLLASDPWHEPALRALMSARYESGDASGALSDYALFERQLRAEMNVAPMPETTAVRDAILRGGSVGNAAAVSEPSAKRAPAASPFVGRAAELERLRARWLRAARGTGGLAFVRGEAGIGKSRLVSELALTAEGEGGRVLSGATSSPESEPYQCLSAALRDALPLVAGAALAPPFLATIAELVPELRSYRPDVPAMTRLDAASERARLLDAIAAVFVAVARPRPMLVILEDLHRAGAATIEALRGILQRIALAPVLIVATYRPEAAGRDHPLRVLAQGSGTPIETIDVGPLGETEVGALIEAVNAPEPLPPEFLTSLMRRGGGNPLFVTELLRDAGRPDRLPRAMPASISAMVTERVASLSPVSRIVAEVAAVSGEAFTAELVREIAGISSGEFLDGLDELLDRHLVRESTDLGFYEYAFTHHLVHGAIYEAIPEDMRKRRHRRVARILDASIGATREDRAREVALHYERGGDPGRAASYYAAAARRAARFHACEEARDLIDRSLALDSADDRDLFDRLLLRSKMNARLDIAAESADLDRLETVALRIDEEAVCAVLARRVDLAYRRGEHAAEVEVIAQLSAHAESLRNDRWLAAAAEARARRAEREGDHVRAIENALDACARYERLGDDANRARYTAFAAMQCSVITGRAAQAQELLAEAFRVAERSGDPEPRIWVLRYASAVAHERQDYAHAAELNRSRLAICLEIGDRLAEGACRASLGLSLWGSWQLDEALASLREALQLSETLGLTQRIAGLTSDAAMVLLEAGDFQGVLAACRRAADVAARLHAKTDMLAAYLNAAGAEWQSGDVSGMTVSLGSAAPIAERLPEGRMLAAYLLERGRLLRCSRDFAGSERSLERALAIFEECARWADVMEALDDLAVTYLGWGRIAQAREALERGDAVRHEHSPVSNRPVFRGWIDACVHRSAGETEAARRALSLANDTYLRRLASLADPQLRTCYERMPVHRALRAALDDDLWPGSGAPCVIAFAAPGRAGRPARC
jgi:predicted ATPase/DNA-binding SARP family transcriptional activator